MLNQNNERELAYVVRVGWVQPIEGADNIELIGINGWTCIAKKGEFVENDLAIYFEIDSKLPEDAEWAAFMAPKHFKVKTMKLGKFKVISQGLALPASAFGWQLITAGQFAGDLPIRIQTPDGKTWGEGAFLTKELGVTYASEEDNKRKANTEDKYKKMAGRHPKLFKNKFIKWLYKRMWGKKLLFVFFGKKKDKKSAWPVWVVKTDEERIECIPWILKNKDTIWMATEKLDGTSSTYTLRRQGFKKDFYVCSRNVVFDTPNKECYYDTNVYVEMEEKYNIRGILETLLNENPDLVFVTLQGETYGEGIQKRNYSLKGHNFAAFNLIYGYKDGTTKRFNPKMMKRILDNFEIPCVPILNESYILPDTIEELREYVNSEGSKIDGQIKEGIVFRSLDGKQSFKCVSPEFLLRFHQ